jgi:uncharacterized protein (TIGR00266 family)
MAEIISGNVPEFADNEGAGVAHRVIGTVMPVLEISLQPSQAVVSNGGELSWMSSTIAMTTKTAGAGQSGVMGVFKRVVSGGSLFMTEYQAQGAPGTVAFATKLPGLIKPVAVSATQEYMVSQHGFMAATLDVTLNIGFQQKLGAGIFGGAGFILQRVGGSGVAWIELSGELVEYDLAAGEVLMVHPGHIGLFEAGLTFEIQMVKGVKNMLFGADSIFLAKLTGPGKVWLQTLTLPNLAHALTPYLPTQEGNTGGGGNLGRILGAATNNL